MRPMDVTHMFSSFSYYKTIDEIREKINQKLIKMKEKIAERETRVLNLRKEYQIDDAALAQLLIASRQQAKSGTLHYKLSNYESSSSDDPNSEVEERVIGAGVVNNLLTENDFIESEKIAVKRLEFINRNLRPIVKFSPEGNAYEVNSFALTPEECEFLAF